MMDTRWRRERGRGAAAAAADRVIVVDTFKLQVICYACDVSEGAVMEGLVPLPVAPAATSVNRLTNIDH